MSKRLNYTQTTTLTLKQKRAWKSTTTTTWLWSSWRKTFTSLLLLGESSWFLDLMHRPLQKVWASLCAHFLRFRPICLPCTKETSQALGLVGVSTCKQQGEPRAADTLQLRLRNVKSKKFRVLLLIVDTKLIPSVFVPHSVLSCLRRNSLSNFIRFALCFFVFFLHTEEKLLTTDVEKLFFLTKKNSVVHKKEVHAKLGDNVSLEFRCNFRCIGFPNEKITFLFFYLAEGWMHPIRFAGWRHQDG